MTPEQEAKLKAGAEAVAAGRALLGIDERITKFLEALGIADIGNTQRIIVDIPLDDVVRVYVTYVSDSKAFDLHFSAGDFQIVAIDKPVVNGEIDMTSRADHGWLRTQRV